MLAALSSSRVIDRNHHGVRLPLIGRALPLPVPLPSPHSSEPGALRARIATSQSPSQKSNWRCSALAHAVLGTDGAGITGGFGVTGAEQLAIASNANMRMRRSSSGELAHRCQNLARPQLRRRRAERAPIGRSPACVTVTVSRGNTRRWPRVGPESAKSASPGLLRNRPARSVALS